MINTKQNKTKQNKQEQQLIPIYLYRKAITFTT